VRARERRKVDKKEIIEGRDKEEKKGRMWRERARGE